MIDLTPTYNNDEMDHESGNSFKHNHLKSLASRLQFLRKRAGTTQEQLAELVETSQANINRWENGKTKPRPVMAAKLATALGASIQWIITGSEEGISTKIPVLGYVAAQLDEHSAIFPFDEYASGNGMYEVDAPVILEDGYVALEIRGPSQEPVYRDRDIVIYRREGDFILEKCLNRMCVVKLNDESILLKEVRRSKDFPRRYDLHSFNSEPMVGKVIEWAAPIKVHLPR